MNEQIEKIIDIINKDYTDRGKSYYIFGIEFDDNGDTHTECMGSIDKNKFIITKYILGGIIDKHIEELD